MRISKVIAVLLLVLNLGAHWTLLQSVAWVSMLVRYSHQDGLKVAVVKTFDGRHPCSLCKVVEQERNAESRSSDSLTTVPTQYDWIFSQAVDVYSPGPRLVRSVTGVDEFLVGCSARPPTPPPRFS